MSETFFPINDLLRRRLQTSLIIISLTLSVASTLFLLLFTQNLGLGISSIVEGRLTPGFSTAFSQFILFVSILVLVVGAVIMSFMVFVMMSQRIRDIGLMKAAGCPNNLIFGYFMSELLIVTSVGCVLGVILGIIADFASISLLNASGFQISQNISSFWLVLPVFGLFFALALIFGAKPVLDTTKVEPAKAFSPVHYLGLSRESGFGFASKSGFTLKFAMRSLFRRKSATLRIILCLTAVFILVTVAVAGGIIADQTTKSWVEKAVGRDVILVAHLDLIDQYKQLLSKFYEVKAESSFNYTDQRYQVSQDVLDQLNSTPGVMDIDARLIMESHVMEVPGYTVLPEGTVTWGDDREGESIIVGVDPEKVLGEWFVEGEFLNSDQAYEAVIGDSLGQKMFSMPLVQSISLYDNRCSVVGVCLDPLNNGNVTYVPLKTLENITGLSRPNIVMVRIAPSANHTNVLNQIKTGIASINPEFAVFELNEVLNKSLDFLGFIWSTIMFLPLFSLLSASLCLMSYVMLAIAEQRQEFGVLRAVGAKPITIVKIVSGQSLMVLLSSCAVGISFGIIITLLILVSKPFVTVYTVIQIAGWLLAALAAIFVISLYPAFMFAKRPIPEILA